MPADLTAILLPASPRGPNPNDIINVVAQNSPHPVWVRLAPLLKVGLHQLEVLEGNSGLPSVAPALVEALSKNDGKALFLHVNQQAKQALLHAFEDGVEVQNFTGEPGEEFEKQVLPLCGCTVEEMLASDDGTRLGFGQAASRTAALVRGRLVLVPAGTPTGMSSFIFHDRGHDVVPAGETKDGEEEEDHSRVAFFAFDNDLITKAWNELPGKQLAQVIGSAPREVLGPLFSMREPIAKVLSELEGPPGKELQQPLNHLRAFEMLAMSHAAVFTGGDSSRYLDQRVLPLLAIGDATAIIDDDQEAKELEAMDSILSAMVEVLPCPKPPGGYGQLLESLGNGEVDALAPWAKPGEAYEGIIFRIKPERLLKEVRALDGAKVAQRLDQFCRALYEARHGVPPKEEIYLGWRAAFEERSTPDIERFLTDWAELRIVLEIATLNKLTLGLVVYHG